MAAPRLMTAAQYFNTPETLTPAELAYGVLRVCDAPSPRHQSAVASLFRALDRHVRTNYLGDIWLAPIDVVLDFDKALIVQPDLLFIANARRWIVQDRIRGAPDLVLEVLSPQPRIGRTEERIGWFREYGVRECWLVHQDRGDVTVLDFTKNTECVFRERAPIRSQVLPEFCETLRHILDA